MKRREFMYLLGGALQVAVFPSLLCASGSIKDVQYDETFDAKSGFDTKEATDLFLEALKFETLKKATFKLSLLQKEIGYSNFALIGFDEAISLVKKYPKIEPFNRDELSLFDELFHFPAERYGFMGQKPMIGLVQKLEQKELTKVPYTGQYLYKGRSLKLYEQIKKEIGGTIILTSGVRGMMKQFYLFFVKAINSGGNLSLASRSLAPPGYSYHGVGDFDVGKSGFGVKNFSVEFEKTKEYRRLIELGYVDIRYFKNNGLGVQFEPWHIKAV